MSIRFIKSNANYLNDLSSKLGITQNSDLQHLMPVLFSNFDKSFVNSLRRVIQAEIPVYAFDPTPIDSSQQPNHPTTKIVHNTSQYNSEVLMQRFGLLSINTDYINQHNYDPSKLKFILCDSDVQSKSFKNKTNQIIQVMLKDDVQVFYDDKKIPIDPFCEYNTLLLTLRPEEEIFAVMSPVLGIGKDNARWQSGFSMYKFCTKKDLEHPAQSDPETNEERMDYIGKESKNPTNILLTVESYGKMSAHNLLINACDVLQQRLGKIRKDIMDGVIPIEQSDIVHSPTLGILTINGEDHTIGNLLESNCLRILPNIIHSNTDKLPNKEEAYQKILSECMFAYKQEHPLFNYIKFIVRTPPDVEIELPKQYNDLASPIGILLMSIDDLIKQYQSVKSSAETFQM